LAGQFEAQLRPRKEVSTKFGFKGLNLIAHARLGEVNFLGRTGDVSTSRNREERLG
jgi:hypothetical protein